MPERETTAETRVRGKCTAAPVVFFVSLMLFAQAPAVIADALAVPDLSNSTHHELTELGARWDELSDDERRALLREVKLRMAQRKDADGVLMIRTQRRYGRIYRNSDGRVLRIETQVVEVRPAEGAGERAGFGVGFERRSAVVPAPQGPETADNAAPGVLVNDPIRH